MDCLGYLFLSVQLLFRDRFANLVDFVEVPPVCSDAGEGLEDGELFEDGSLGESGEEFEEAHAEEPDCRNHHKLPNCEFGEGLLRLFLGDVGVGL